METARDGQRRQPCVALALSRGSANASPHLPAAARCVLLVLPSGRGATHQELLIR